MPPLAASSAEGALNAITTLSDLGSRRLPQIAPHFAARYRRKQAMLRKSSYRRLGLIAGVAIGTTFASTTPAGAGSVCEVNGTSTLSGPPQERALSRVASGRTRWEGVR